jgi:hypothetical protein
MSSVDERTGVQAKMQVDVLETENAGEHTRLETMMTHGFKTTDRKLDRLSTRLGIGGLLVAIATILSPTLSTVAAFQGKAETKLQAVEATRQEFANLAGAWRSEFRAECRTRDQDLEFMAEKAADKSAEKTTARLVRIPQETITK